MTHARRTAVFAIVVLIAIVLFAVLYMRFVIQSMRASGLRALEADACVPQNTPEGKTNPNKMLFLSCGGFLQ